ncbi:MAG TPA: cation-transporting P-type ATPase [Nocardioides sp.]|nr:cation-transporting P-type ATPase [Nocardioides sp.]
MPVLHRPETNGRAHDAEGDDHPRHGRPPSAGSPLVLPMPDLLARLDAGGDGLTAAEASRRLAESGPNVLTAGRGGGLLAPLVRQLIHPLALLLWAAAALAFATQGLTLGIAIVAVIALNATFALVQEHHAQHAVAALSQYLPAHATVVRDGHEQVVDAVAVVPGDLLVVAEGDAISADARVIDGALEVDLSAINGESAPVLRRVLPAEAPGQGPRRVVEAEDVLLSGTTCTGGAARALVVCTGMSTELGRIATLSRRTGQESSPLELQVRRVAWLIAGVAVLVGVAFLPLGMLAGLSFTEAAVFGIGLLVANVPEGLLPTITLALAVGVGDLARRGGLVKRLSAVETLGSTDVICTDKTGTLTQNRMQVHSVWGPSGKSTPAVDGDVAPLARVLRTCSTADRATGRGDPTELALLDAADRIDRGGAGAERLATYAFDPRVRLMTVVGRGDEHEGAVACTKGAPESVLARCVAVAGPGGTTGPLTDERREALTHRLQDLASQGLRLIACAHRVLPPDETPGERESVEHDLVLLGLVALTDPIRDAVPAAVREAHAAGIRVHVITGDNGATAGAIARAAGIGAVKARVVTGEELDAMADPALDAILGNGHEIVFARSSPEDKLRIATRLQAAGHVVAMTGDGVNDAPALRHADIGVAMGRSGTDVAREAATMVLTDDDFATIIRAVESGRRVYDNVRKFILYIFAHAVPEVVPFLLFALSGGAIPLGLTVAQILMIDLGTETLPALALGREQAEPGIMERSPRPRRENIITGSMLVRAWGVLGVTSALLVTGGFLWVLRSGGWTVGADVSSGTPLHEVYLRATTMAFAGIVVCQVGTAMAARTDRVSLLRIGFLGNRLLLAGIAFELAVGAVAVYVPLAQQVLGTRPLHAGELAVLAVYPVVVWGVDEGYRWVLRRRDRRGPEPVGRRGT